MIGRTYLQMIFNRSVLVFFSLLCISCTSQKKVVYMQDDHDSNSGTLPDFILMIIPGDILSIQVYTVNTEAFPGIASEIDKQVIDNRSAYEKGFVVDNAGVVELPLIGRVKLSELSISDAKDTLSNRFRVYMDDPVVILKKLSFKITVLGEVNKPGLYYIPNEKLTLLEALGMAGDLTYYGDRKEIKVIRRDGNNYREIIVDITTKEPLKSDVAFVHPDDVIYVKPVKRRNLANLNPGVGVITSIIATLTLIASVILREN